MGRHAVQRPRTAISLVAAAGAAALVAAILSVNGAATAEAPRLSDNLVSNPDFESGNAGWNTQNSKVTLSSGAGHESRRAAKLTALARTNLLLNDSPNVIASAAKGDRYVASVWVRTDTPRLGVTFRFREVAGLSLVGKTESKAVLTDGAWHQLSAEYTAVGDGTQIAVQVLALKAAKGDTFSVDDVDVRKVLTDRDQPEAKPAPKPTKTEKPKPSPTESATAKPEPTKSEPAKSDNPKPPSAAKGNTLFGASVYTGDGTSFATALARSNANYGGLKVVRVFFPGMPSAWPGKAGSTGGPVVVSFKASPQQVVSGNLDGFFRNWFANAPRDRDIYWTNFHEPEDNIEKGQFTATQYREALRRLDGLADAAGNPRLHTATIWMCYDLRKGSGRDWKDYYPGSDVVDLMGWDCYNRGRDNGTYDSPASILDDLRIASESMGKPWGLGEFASKLAPGDNGQDRAAWLKASAEYFRSHDATFVNYFDAFGGAVANPEYRLLDAPSRAAWKWVVSGS